MTTVLEPPGWKDELTEELDETWHSPPGLHEWISTVDHKRIGMRYFYLGMVFFIIGGVQSLLIRMQLAGPDLDLLSPVYAATAAYGHFGREAEGDTFPWEKTDLVEALKEALA